MRVRFVLSEMALGLRRNLSLTFAVIITVAVSLALIGAGLLIRDQINTMKGYWYDKINVSIFLCGSASPEPTCHGSVTPAEKAALRGELSAMPQVQKVYFESSQQAYQNYKKLFKNSPDLVKNVDPASLPQSFRVKLRNPNEIGSIIARFSNQPGVQLVQDQRALVGKLFQVLHGFQVAAYVIAATLFGAAAFLIFNTIRVAAYSRRRETGIMRLVGASRFYIQLPFLLEGAIVGLIGAVFGTAGLVLFKYVFIDRGLQPNIRSISFIGWDWVWTVVPVLFLIGIGMASVASLVTIRRYLRV